ncbi:aminodeoxychorismate synthase component I [Candidatus Contubernalis alkaliaceticus]|uniref:aminodeoxychorismate synthase component I n=1 Tax=Candidatus Contubernalis alkaliaceticus TaxID=338645 RepID=UPI001F4C4813|nr:aminodeoxychorismate synthase component I [Candidatus Contubernalis alkalaceticus]UNC92390.1 aminodeoxychorismate synthase component I [Candidatus Contubernalis alkalaceticus]
MKVAAAVKELKPIISPFDVYCHIKDKPYSFILDSRMDPDRLGRYSFVGADPFALFRSKGNQVYIWQEKQGETRLIGSPFKLLKEFLNNYQMITELPSEVPPFSGGAVGYFGYELGEVIEELPGNSSDDLMLPDCLLGFYDRIYAFDHLLNKVFIFTLGRSKTEEEAVVKADEMMKEFSKEIENIQDQGAKEPDVLKKDPFQENSKDEKNFCEIKHKLKSNFTREQYCSTVQKVKQYIAAGDIYQANLSQRFETDLTISPFDLYCRLRTINPAPFASFLNFGDVVVASASPERFLLLSDKIVETRPIKGTRPRSSDPKKDLEYREELLNSEKDRAELIMIVDLERNDLGRVCLPGTVKVTELFALEAYATVYHLVSTVTGVLPEDKDITDLLYASFPGGSITGAPKIRAMEIIDELEGLKRNVYTGSIGYITLDGKADLNIVIRTFVVKNNKVYFQVGGGIVADSEPEKEYQETLDKAKALIESLSI